MPSPSLISLPFAQLVADDIDSGEFGKVNYSISDGNIGSVFWINSSSGGLYVTGYLDRETTDSYTLTVTASDGGKHVEIIIATIIVFAKICLCKFSPQKLPAIQYLKFTMPIVYC